MPFPRQGLPNRTYITAITVVPATHEAALALAKESLRLMRGFSKDATMATVAGQPCYITSIQTESEEYYPDPPKKEESEVAEEENREFRVTREQYNNMMAFFEKYFVEPPPIPTTYTPLDHEEAVRLMRMQPLPYGPDRVIGDLRSAGYELCRRDPR